MGQITIPAAPGITVLPTDRQTGPSAGAGNSGNYTIFLGANSGNNNTSANSIAIGNSALAGGLANMPGTIAIGVNAGAALNNSQFTTGLTIIGDNALAAANQVGDGVYIGSKVFLNAPFQSVGTQGYSNVAIGASILPTFGQNYAGSGGIIYSILIGSQIGPQAAASGGASMSGAVIMGYQAIPNWSTNPTGYITSTVAIGESVLPNFSTSGGTITNSVIIGDSGMLGADGGVNGTSDWIAAIGSQTNFPGNTQIEYSTAIGGSAWAGAAYTTTLGYNAGNAAGAAGTYPNNYSIYIGANAGYSGAMPAYGFLVETSDGATTHTLLYGEMDLGNLYSGQLPYADRDLRTINCTNALKLTNGTRGAGNPVGGGFFYVSAGALHWVGTSGTDTTLAPA